MKSLLKLILLQILQELLNGHLLKLLVKKIFKFYRLRMSHHKKNFLNQ